MASKFTSVNHYVPQWYQHLFIPDDRSERRYQYLDLKPDRIPNPTGGGFHFRNERRPLGPLNCFHQEHLYTMFFGANATDAIEKSFFGKIDNDGARAVEFFHSYEFNGQSQRSVHDLVDFMGAQKLRTPKGLDFLKSVVKGENHQQALVAMQRLFQIHITMWMECVWEVLYYDDSPTKFIVTDHPVATYNKGLFPKSVSCTYPNDPLIELLGTHTIFPLGLNRCLVLTNLGYVRDPWANPLKPRVNARAYQNTMFDLRKVQRGRQISEHDVRAINYILKTGARRFIAASEREWLYPEKHFAKTMWNKLGDNFFLMPDARKVSFTTDIVMGFRGGTSMALDEYGRTGGQRVGDMDAHRRHEFKTLEKHKRRWEQKFGELSREELREFF